jgi:hypothetical protein
LLALCFHRLSFPVALHLVSLARSIFFTCHQCCLLTFPACSPVAEACSLAAFFFLSSSMLPMSQSVSAHLLAPFPCLSMAQKSVSRATFIICHLLLC